MLRYTALSWLFTMLALTSCASQPQAGVDPLGASPSDFSLDVTVLTAGAARADEETSSVGVSSHLRPARYVLLADGTLRYGNDPDGAMSPNWLPPVTRILSRRQIADVWSLCQQLGLTDPNAGDPIVNFRLVRPSSGERMYMVGLSGSGDYRNFVRSAPINQEPDPAMAKLVRLLAELAWADEMRDADARIAPKRYDFGPDPYTRYRSNN